MVILSTKEVAEIFGVTQQSLSLWAGRGCPKQGHGKWDIAMVLQWWLDNLYQSGDDTEEMAQAKLEYWQAKARNESVKADISEGKVIPVDEIKKAWAWRVSEMSNGLGSLPMRLAPLIAQKNERETRSILDSEIWKIRDQFSRTGKFTPATNKKGKK